MSGASKNTRARILFSCIFTVAGTVMACMTLRLTVPVLFDAITLALSVSNHLMVGAHRPRYSNEQLNVNILPTGTSEVISGCVHTGSVPANKVMTTVIAVNFNVVFTIVYFLGKGPLTSEKIPLKTLYK